MTFSTYHGVDADHLPPVIHEWSAAVAAVERGVRLYVRALQVVRTHLVGGPFG